MHSLISPASLALLHFLALANIAINDIRALLSSIARGGTSNELSRNGSCVSNSYRKFLMILSTKNFN